MYGEITEATARVAEQARQEDIQECIRHLKIHAEVRPDALSLLSFVRGWYQKEGAVPNEVIDYILGGDYQS